MENNINFQDDELYQDILNEPDEEIRKIRMQQYQEMKNNIPEDKTVRKADNSYYDTLLTDDLYLDILNESDDEIRELRLKQYINILEEKRLEKKINKLKLDSKVEELNFKRKYQNVHPQESKYDQMERMERLERERKLEGLVGFIERVRRVPLKIDDRKFQILFDEMKKYIDGEEFISKSSLDFLLKDYRLDPKIIKDLELYEENSENFEDEYFENEEY